MHVCVEIDMQTPLREGVWIGLEGRGFFHVVAYENLPAFSENCGCVGHKVQDYLTGDKENKDSKEEGGKANLSAKARVPEQAKEAQKTKANLQIKVARGR